MHPQGDAVTLFLLALLWIEVEGNEVTTIDGEGGKTYRSSDRRVERVLRHLHPPIYSNQWRPQ